MAGKQKTTVDVLDTPAARALINHMPYVILDAIQAEGLMEHSEEIAARITAKIAVIKEGRRYR